MLIQARATHIPLRQLAISQMELRETAVHVHVEAPFAQIRLGCTVMQLPIHVFPYTCAPLAARQTVAFMLRH